MSASAHKYTHLYNAWKFRKNKKKTSIFSLYVINGETEALEVVCLKQNEFVDVASARTQADSLQFVQTIQAQTLIVDCDVI